MKIAAFFQLIRWKNLSMYIFTLLLIKYVLFKNYNTVTFLSDFEFILLLISIVLVAGGGYIINDIYDLKTDLINKPKKVLVGSVFSLKEVKIYYALLTAFGTIAGIYLSIKIGFPQFSYFFIIMAFLLFFYSSKLKKIALLGNFTIALLVILSLLIIGVFELIPSIPITSGIQEGIVLELLLIYALFSASINFIREIVKDIEDVDGDFSQNMKTLPILVGRDRSGKIVILLSVVFVLSLFITLFLNRVSNINLYLLGLVFIILPLLYFISKTYSAETKSDYHKLSSLLKLIMVFGILAIFVL